MKLNAFNSQHHSDEEIESRLRQIDTDITHRLSYTGVNRHTADTRIGLIDSAVPVEVMVEL